MSFDDSDFAADAENMMTGNYEPVLDRYAAKVAVYFDGDLFYCHSRDDLRDLMAAQMAAKRVRGIVRTEAKVLLRTQTAGCRAYVRVGWTHHFSDGRPVEKMEAGFYFEPTPAGDRIGMVDCMTVARPKAGPVLVS